VSTVPNPMPSHLQTDSTGIVGSPAPSSLARTRFSGIYITLALIGVLEIFSRTVSDVPTPVGIGLLGVVYAAFVGGTWPGMVSAALLAVYAVYAFAIPGSPLHFTSTGVWRLTVTIIILPTIVVMIGTLKRRAERANQYLRRQAILEAQIEERSRIGRALKRERNEQQTIFHSVPAMIWFKDLHNRILRANQLAAQSIGRTVEEIEGKSTFDLYPHEAAKYQKDDLEVIESGKPKLGIIERYEIPSGEIRWVRTDKIPYRNSDDEIVGVVVFAVDISEQKSAQEELQNAHDDLDRRVQARTMELTQANERLRREIAEREQAERVISERNVLAQFAADVGAALTRGKNLREMLQECCEAMVRHLEAAFARIWVLDDASQTLHLLGSAGLYTHIDGGHSRIAVGTLKVGLIAQERRPHLTNNVLGDARIGDQEWAKREGMVAFAGYPLLIGERVIGVMALFARKPLSILVTGAMGAVADTLALGIERLRASFELQQHAEALEKANDALREAEEAALSASSAKSRFLANISHEIRTPIMAMLGAAELLQSDENVKQNRADRGDMILRNGRHLLSLIDELLDFSRLEAGKLEIRFQSCSLIEILADVEAITEPMRQDKTLDYRIIYETPVPDRIYTDCTRLTQAVSNLVNNALKFTKQGFVRVRVRVDRDAAEPRLTITVDDSGIGIRPSDRERIFDSFTQIEPTWRGANAGVGLGLPIAKLIAEKLGGTLEVKSEFGQGSSFSLRVTTGPLDGVSWIDPADASLRFSIQQQRAECGTPYRLQGRVLLAEDAGNTRELIQHALRSCGAEVTAVENGRKAVEAAMRDRFDLILMDIRMPELDGLGAVAELRKKGCCVPIVALTASTSDRQQIQAAGFDDFWFKPISLTELVNRVAAFLPSVGGRRNDPDQDRDWDSKHAALNARMNRIVEEFVSSLPARVGTIRNALHAADFHSAQEALHQLVGTAGIHGFTSLSDEAGRLLQSVKNNSTGDKTPDLSALERIAATLQGSVAGDADSSSAGRICS